MEPYNFQQDRNLKKLESEKLLKLEEIRRTVNENEDIKSYIEKQKSVIQQIIESTEKTYRANNKIISKNEQMMLEIDEQNKRVAVLDD